MKELKKKPGDMQKARKRHLQQQARRDALSKLRNGESINVWAHYEDGSAKVIVEPVEACVGDYVLAIVSKRLRIMYFSDYRKNGAILGDNYRDVVIPYKRISGVVSRFLDFHQKCSVCGFVNKHLDLEMEESADFGRSKIFTYDITCKQCKLYKFITFPNRIDNV